MWPLLPSEEKRKGAARRSLQSNEPTSLNRRPFNIRGPVPIARRCARKDVQTRDKPRLHDLRGYRFWELGLLQAPASSRLRMNLRGYPIAIRPDTRRHDSRAANEGSFVTDGESPKAATLANCCQGHSIDWTFAKRAIKTEHPGCLSLRSPRDFNAMPVKALR